MPDIVGVLVIEQSGVTTLGGTDKSISELLVNVMQPDLMNQVQESLAQGGLVRYQFFDLVSGDVLFELTVDFKKPFEEVLKFQSEP